MKIINDNQHCRKLETRRHDTVDEKEKKSILQVTLIYTRTLDARNRRVSK